MLTKPMKKFLKLGNVNKQGYNVPLYYKRAVEDGQIGIEDLTLLAKRLPEKRLAKLFTDDALEPLIDAILGEDHLGPVNNRRIYLITYMLVIRGLAKTLRLMDLAKSPYYHLFREDIERIKVWMRGAGDEVWRMEATKKEG